ncbi:hypothetical protein CDV55_100650 [Aspergillus turcosus]|nr:hypothetical protein CDV55_100650 [Aspergillus turcosus]
MAPATTTMQAIQLTRETEELPPAMSFTTLPIPKVTPGYALVKIIYSNLNPSDRANAKGDFAITSYPRVLGRDYSGIIVDGPSDRIGEEVYGTSGGVLGFTMDGVHAQYCVLPENCLVTKPKNLSFLQAAVVGVPFTTASLCLRRTRATSKDIVLVLGANGAVGSAAVQIAKAMGCKKVIRVARGQDADVNLTLDPELQTVGALTDGKGVDVVVDTVGNLDLMKSAFDRLARLGRYGYIAAPRGGASTDFTIDILQGYRMGIELIGCNTGFYTLEEVAADMAQLKEWFESGAITTKSDECYDIIPLEEAVQIGYGRAPSKRPTVISMVSEN